MACYIMTSIQITFCITVPIFVVKTKLYPLEQSDNTRYFLGNKVIMFIQH